MLRFEGFGGLEVLLEEKPEDDSSTGNKVWETAKVLVKYLDRHKGKLNLNKKRIIELGAGCGLTGILLAAYGATVITTDIEPVISLLRKNASLNQPMITKGKLEVRELNWGEDVSSFDPPFDLVVGSDVVYKMDLVKPLVDTMNVLCGTSTVCLLCLEIRDTSVHTAFLEEAAKYFVVSQVPRNRYHPEYTSEYCLLYSFRKKIV